MCRRIRLTASHMPGAIATRSGLARPALARLARSRKPAVSARTVRACSSKHGAFAGELDAAGRAHEQLHAELPFELADLAAQRGLGDVQLPRGFRKAVRLGDGGKRTQVTELHVRVPAVYIRSAGSAAKSM